MKQRQFIPRHQSNPTMFLPKPVERPMNEAEVGDSLTLSIAIHYVIRQMDKLSETNQYRHSLKLTGNQFLKELESHSSDALWSKKIEGVDYSEAASQMDKLSQLFHNLLQLCLSVQDIPDGQLPLFWLEMQRNFKRFGIPLQMAPDGDLTCVEVKKVV